MMRSETNENGENGENGIFNFSVLSLVDIAGKILEEWGVIDTKIQSESKVQSRRKLIANEIYTTERTYVNHLKNISENFIQPLSEPSKKPILPQAQVKQIFANWKSIMICHIETLELLRESIQTWGPNQLIGCVFAEAKMNSITQLYKFYINNFDRSIAVMEHYRQKSPQFKKFIDQAVNLHGKGLDVGSFLILPVQRITRYVLLFDSLLKCTKKTHPDYNNLEKAHERFKAMADFINVSKKNTEKFLEAKKICSNIKHFPTETLLSTAGVALIKTYNLLLTDNPSEKPQPEKDKDKEKEKDKVFIALLNNCLVISDSKKGQKEYHFKTNLPLSKTKFILEKENSKSVLICVPRTDETTVFVGDQTKFKLYSSENDDDIDNLHSEIVKACAEKVHEDDSETPAGVSENPNPVVDVFEKKRTLIDSFLQKEVQYVHHLKGLKEFMDITIICLEEPDKKAKYAEAKKIFIDFFASVKPIIGCHLNMLAMLFERSAQLEEKNYCVADIFEKNLEVVSPRYDLYSLLWEELRPVFIRAKSDMKTLPIKFWTHVAKFEAEQNMQMEIFLEQVSQRIPFLSNVLSDLLKSTPPDNTEYISLEMTVTKIKRLSEKILTLKEISHQQDLEKRIETEKDKTKKSSRMMIRKAMTIGGADQHSKKNK